MEEEEIDSTIQGIMYGYEKEKKYRHPISSVQISDKKTAIFEIVIFTKKPLPVWDSGGR